MGRTPYTFGGRSYTIAGGNFERPFILDVEWSIKGVGSILSQKQNKHECVIAYASKGLTPS
jgi:hypothetical protein